MHSFPRQVRLNKKQDFEAIFAHSRQAKSEFLRAVFLPNQKTFARLGIMLAKRHLPLAVHRNRMRRVIRESFRRRAPSLKGLDIVVLLRSKWSPSRDDDRLQEDILKLWQKLMLL